MKSSGSKKKAKKKVSVKEINEVRNAKRRAVYAESTEARAKAIEASRATYRAKNKVKLPPSCLGNIKKLEKIGFRAVRADGLRGVVITAFGAPELAKAINTPVLTLRRMQADGRFPIPRVIDQLGSAVYTLPQVERFIKIMSAHYKEVAYLRASHTETVQKLHSVMQEVE